MGGHKYIVAGDAKVSSIWLDIHDGLWKDTDLVCLLSDFIVGAQRNHPCK